MDGLLRGILDSKELDFKLTVPELACRLKIYIDLKRLTN
jgi:hypothetical protein